MIESESIEFYKDQVERVTETAEGVIDLLRLQVIETRRLEAKLARAEAALDEVYAHFISNGPIEGSVVWLRDTFIAKHEAPNAFAALKERQEKETK